jgi:hypothetical protein
MPNIAERGKATTANIVNNEIPRKPANSS